jgi:CheY-like chemotaxis protein
MRKQPSAILIVEDDRNDQDLMIQAFHGLPVSEIICCLSDGSEAIAYLDGKGKFSDRDKYPFPSVILTDLKIPIVDGFAVLAHLKRRYFQAAVPAIVVSASDDPDDINRAYLCGASAYFVKSPDFSGLEKLLKRIYEYWTIAETPMVNSRGEVIGAHSHGKAGEHRPNS